MGIVPGNYRDHPGAERYALLIKHQLSVSVVTDPDLHQVVKMKIINALSVYPHPLFASQCQDTFLLGNIIITKFYFVFLLSRHTIRSSQNPLVRYR